MPAVTEIESLVAQLGSIFAWRRREAADVLAEVGPAVCAPLLSAVSTNPRLMGSTEAISLLTRLQYPEAVDLLTKLLCAPVAATGPVAADVLRRIGGCEAVCALTAGLWAALPDSRAAAARALGAIGDRQAVGPLCRMLTSRETFWHRPLAEIPAALGRIGDPQAVPFLLEPKLPFEETRELALIRIGRRGIRPLAEAIRPESGKDSLLAMRVLLRLGAEALPVLADLQPSDCRLTAARVEVLQALLLDPDPIRIPVLLSAFRDPSEGIAGLAVQAVTRLAQAGFAHLLRPAIPHLRSLRARKWGNDAVRSACRRALEAIEEQKASLLGSLPLPSERGSADALLLPLPMRDGAGVGTELPVPSGEAPRL